MWSSADRPIEQRVTLRGGSDKLISMRAPKHSNGRAQRPPLPASEGYQRRPTSKGQGLPAPSFADLDDEETVTYDARATPAVAMPALRAECLDEHQWGDAMESDVHGVEANQNADDLVPPDSHARLSRPAEVPSNPVRVSSPNQRERVAAAFFGKVLSTSALIRTPSANRSSFAKALVVTVLAIVLMLVAMEISIGRNLPWLDPRLMFAKLWNVVAQKIPWDSLPKLPKF